MALYSDFDISFTRDAISGDIALVEDTQAVAQSVRNLIMTNFYERPFQPSLGSAVSLRLFDQLDNIAQLALTQDIRDVLRLFEPRAEVRSVRVYTSTGPNGEYIDKNAVLLVVIFAVQNLPQLVTTQIVLTRLR